MKSSMPIAIQTASFLSGAKHTKSYRPCGLPRLSQAELEVTTGTVARRLREDVTASTQHSFQPTSTKWANTIAQVCEVRQGLCLRRSLSAGLGEIAGEVA